MPPTSSISRASTVAKIGRPMKKLTMAVLAPVACVGVGGSGRVPAGRGPAGSSGHGFRLRLAGRLRRPAGLARPRRSGGRPGSGPPGASGEAGSALTVIPARTSCSPSTITGWPGSRPDSRTRRPSWVKVARTGATATLPCLSTV